MPASPPPTQLVHGRGLEPPCRYTLLLTPRDRCTPTPLHVELEGTDGTATALVHAGPTDAAALQACLHSRAPLGTLTALTVAMQHTDGGALMHTRPKATPAVTNHIQAPPYGHLRCYT